MPLLKPTALRAGDVVRVIAPAGPFERELFDAGLALIAQRYQPRYEESISARWRYLAGDDARRSAELAAAFADDKARAIFCARGGYGATRILPTLSSSWPPKALVGFSDVTALHGALQRMGRASVHGPVLTQLPRLPRSDLDRLFGVLESARPPEPLTGEQTLVAGVAEGPVLGGNLAVFTRLLGTPFLPALDGAVLVFEDIGERPYSLDRMWTHLRLAGAFERVRGIALGDFTGCEEKDADYSSADVLAELAAQTGLPCASGFAFGHGSRNAAVGLGCRARLDASARTLSFLEAAVEERA